MTEEIKEELKSMSLGDHLEELRARMILAILGLFVGMVVCLFFGKSLIRIMSRPFEKKIEKLKESRLVEIRDKQKALGIADEAQAVIVTYDPENGYATYTSFAAIGSLIEALQQDRQAQADPNSPPSDDYRPDAEDVVKEAAVIAHHPTEGFIVYTTVARLNRLLSEWTESGAIIESSGAGVVCMLFGLLLSSPWVIWQIWAFVSAGLYRKEKRYVHVVSPISATLFITGALFFMLVIAPLVMGFLIQFDAAMGVRSFWSLQKYINMVFALTVVFGVAFQMPIIIVFAERLGLVTVDTLAANRKFVILGLVIVAAMATPPDVISQISLAIPLYALYEASIVFCRIWRARGKSEEHSNVYGAGD